MTQPGNPLKALSRSLLAFLLSASASVKNPKSGSTTKATVTIQWLTRGLFKRLDGVIAYPEEKAYLRLPFYPNRAASQFPRARYA